MTRKVALFAEDLAHEAFLTPLIIRLAQEQGVIAQVKPYSTRGGHGKVISELTQYLQEIQRGRTDRPDLLVVATDANCKAYQERKRQVDNETEGFRDLTICAIPDPHIERWLLLDSAAFKAVLGKGCLAPDLKCQRDRYKKLLIEAVREEGSHHC